MSVKIILDDSKLQGKIGEMIKAQPEILRWFTEEGAQIVAGEMFTLSPFRTGFLRSSIITKEKPEGGFFVRPMATYTPPVEKKRGFIKQTVSNVRGALTELAKRILESYYGKS